MAIDLKRSKTERAAAAVARAAVIWLLSIPVPALAADWTYTVRPGDEIWNIASRYCGSASYAEKIIEFNKLDDERRIRPGDRLRIPIDWLVRQPATASVLSVRGTAHLLTPAVEPAQVGREIEMGHRLRTGEGSAVVGFADGSSLRIDADSEVLFNVLTAYGDTGMVDTHLRFYRGRGTSKIIRRGDASSFRISSPTGTAAVRGTEFRVAVESERSLTETLEGSVGFIRDSEVEIPAGFGLAASPSGDISEPLLPMPVWISSSGRYPTGSELRWQTLADASAYRVSVFQADDLLTPVRVATSANAALTLQALPPDAYRVSVRGISRNDLEGYESSLDIVLTGRSPEPTSPAILVRGDTTLRWAGAAAGPYFVEVAKSADFAVVHWREEVHTMHAAPGLAPGEYYWRVKDEQSDFGAPRALLVRPRAPEGLSVSSRPMHLQASWQASEADEYRVRVMPVANPARTVLDTVVKEPLIDLELQKAGQYEFEITAIHNGVSSEPVRATAGVSGRPWWLLGLLVIPFII